MRKWSGKFRMKEAKTLQPPTPSLSGNILIQKGRHPPMYTLTLKLTSINYTETLHALYPYLAQKLKGSQKHPLLLRLYYGMGGKSEAVAEKLLSLLPEAERNGLLVTGLNLFSEKLTEKLNAVLPEVPKVGKISVGRVFAELGEDGSLWLMGADLRRDGQPLGEVSGLQALMEKAAIAALVSDSGSKLLTSVISQGLRNFGLSMTLEELQLVPEEAPVAGEIASTGLTEHQKELLVDALAAFLKESV